MHAGVAVSKANSPPGAATHQSIPILPDRSDLDVLYPAVPKKRPLPNSAGVAKRAKIAKGSVEQCLRPPPLTLVESGPPDWEPSCMDPPGLGEASSAQSSLAPPSFTVHPAIGAHSRQANLAEPPPPSLDQPSLAELSFAAQPDSPPKFPGVVAQPYELSPPARSQGAMRATAILGVAPGPGFAILATGFRDPLAKRLLLAKNPPDPPPRQILEPPPSFVPPPPLLDTTPSSPATVPWAATPTPPLPAATLSPQLPLPLLGFGLVGPPPPLPPLPPLPLPLPLPFVAPQAMVPQITPAAPISKYPPRPRPPPLPLLPLPLPPLPLPLLQPLQLHGQTDAAAQQLHVGAPQFGKTSIVIPQPPPPAVRPRPHHIPQPPPPVGVFVAPPPPPPMVAPPPPQVAAPQAPRLLHVVNTGREDREGFEDEAIREVPPTCLARLGFGISSRAYS